MLLNKLIKIMSKQKIYNHLPYFLKVLILNFFFFINKRKRYDQNFKKYYHEYLNLWEAPLEEIYKFQKKRLIDLLSEVFLYSDWYKSIMKEQNITLEQIKTSPYKVLKKMPFLSKEDRKNYVNEISNKKRKAIVKDFTSGTTGSPTINFLDKESLQRSFALWKRYLKTIGINKEDKSIRFSGKIIVNPNKKKPPFWVYNYVEKQLFMSTYHLTENNLKFYIEKLNSFQPKFIDGYPSAIYIIANYILNNNITLNFNLKAISVTAETLYEFQRKKIEEAFSCKVYNQYASSEGSPIISECKNGNLHLNLDSGIFEFFDNNDKPINSGVANLVVTSLENFKIPLIRYKIGDTILIENNLKKCQCGSNMPIIKNIIGREDDILWTKEKGYVGRMDTAYKNVNGIIRGQLIQENPNKLIVNLEIDDKFDKLNRKKLTSNIKDRLGKNIEVQIQIQKRIKLGANGKFIAVKRNFNIKDYENKQNY